MIAGRVRSVAARLAFLCATVAVAWPVQAAAQRADTVVSEVVAPGITYRRIVRPAGPWVINVIAVDLTRRDYELRHVRARDALVGKERVSEMVARQPGAADAVMAAINGDFFNVRTGENENNQVLGGEWWKGVRVTDSPYDTFANVHAQFGIDGRGRPVLDRFVLNGTVLQGTAAFPLTALNLLPRAGLEATVLYTDRAGTTPRDTVRPMAEVPLRRVAQRGDTVVFVQVGVPSKSGGNPLSAGHAALGAYGPRSTALAKFADGDTIRVVLNAVAERGDGRASAPQMLIGGWPRILRNGENVAVRAAWDEGTLSSNAEMRHPRSAVGFNRDTTRLFLVTVDGRQAASVGMTLTELADLLKELGAWDALNFDGGGSTTLVVRGRIVNHPSDAAGEREVGNALVVVRRPR